MKAAIAALLAIIAVPAVGLAQGLSDERFAAVKLAPGEGLEVVVSNVTMPPVFGGQPPAAPCPVSVEFFTGGGKLLGSSITLHLLPGVSAAVAAVVPAQGLARARIAVVGVDPDASCAIRSNLEVYDIANGATLYGVPGSQCLGHAACAGALP